MKHIRLQFILVYLFLFISLCHSSELPEVFTTLLPAPQSVRLLSAEAGIHPQDIVGYCLKNKAEIPFRQDYFPRKLLKSVRKGTILSHKGGGRLSINRVFWKGYGGSTHASRAAIWRANVGTVGTECCRIEYISTGF